MMQSPFEEYQIDGPAITPATLKSTQKGGQQNPPYLQMRKPVAEAVPDIYGEPPKMTPTAPVVTPNAAMGGDTVKMNSGGWNAFQPPAPPPTLMRPPKQMAGGGTMQMPTNNPSPQSLPTEIGGWEQPLPFSPMTLPASGTSKPSVPTDRTEKLGYLNDSIQAKGIEMPKYTPPPANPASSVAPIAPSSSPSITPAGQGGIIQGGGIGGGATQVTGPNITPNSPAQQYSEMSKQPDPNKPLDMTKAQAGGTNLGDLYRFFASDLQNQTKQAKSKAIADAARRGVYYGTPLTGSEADIDTQYLRGLGQLQAGMYGNEQSNQLERLGLAVNLSGQGNNNAPPIPEGMDWSALGALFGNSNPQQSGTTTTPVNSAITPKPKPKSTGLDWSLPNPFLKE